jgi:hypothetical protein
MFRAYTKDYRSLDSLPFGQSETFRELVCVTGGALKIRMKMVESVEKDDEYNFSLDDDYEEELQTKRL